MRDALPAGTVLGGEHEIIRLLEHGGMGAIYVARQRPTGVLRAVKVMHPRYEGVPELRDRFAREARIAALVGGDHVAQVVGSGVDPALGVPWIAMELLEGRSLGAVMHDGPLDVTLVAEIAAQLVHALTAVHDAGVVHRDLKPDNVFLARPSAPDRPFQVKLVDFGVARLLSESTTLTGGLGTPLYMAPEQSCAPDEVDARTDVWALGLLVFKMLVGVPFWLTAADPKATVDALWREILLDPMPLASERATERGRGGRLPVGFDAWFIGCVNRRAAARFADARAAGEALETVLPRPRPGTIPPPPIERGEGERALDPRAETHAMHGRASNARTTQPKAHPIAPTLPSSGSIPSRLHGKRILIVDDDSCAAASIAKALSDRFEITIASDGAQGLAIAKTLRPDLIITDVTMPELDGLAMVERLRAGTPAPHPPVIFLTGRDGPSDVIRGIQAGARYYLPKPVDLDELERKCERALR
jgi:serine/threonine protein kinase